jgi:hypothetical protein
MTSLTRSGANPAFEVVTTTNDFGQAKELMRLRGDVAYRTIDQTDEEILDYVIATTAPKFWNDFMKLYSTYAIVRQPRYSNFGPWSLVVA